ncbi:MAG: hypothetical protein DI582_04670 [Azospirillum brasilense]|nr:MAG: hypothetical protein DI582_04670 [Azospirillum brasilense]
MRGFSLVELSIVLVILGLLTGGILGGQALIRAAELRSVSNDVAKYITAANTFRDKYLAVPGDMPNAVRFWGAQAGGSADGVDNTCRSLDRNSPATGTPTCNGNGDGDIAQYANMVTLGNPMYESYRAWQHLANAALVEGSYAGVADAVGGTLSSGPGSTLGWNVPASRISRAGYAFVSLGEKSAGNSAVTSGYLIQGSYGNTLLFGFGNGSIYHHMPFGPVISTEESWNIDTKMDDGLPGTGRVMSPGIAQHNCATATSPSATYNFTNKNSAACGLIFKTGF